MRENSKSPPPVALFGGHETGDKPATMTMPPGSTPVGLTQALAGFAAGSARLPAPEAALDAARRAVVDTVGVLLAGRQQPGVARLAATLEDGGEVRSLATGRALRARDCALVDGMAAHALDYDDVAQHGHPSVVIVPALMAEAQRRRATGRAFLRACVVGYEAWAELAAREPGALHLGAWHPTPFLGIVSATAGLCALAGLDEARARNALAIACSFASGVIANFGSDAKPLQAGRGAAGAVEAVRLAEAGLGGSADALEGQHGLLAGLSPDGRGDRASPLRAGTGGWQLLEQGLSVKRYPVCYASHRAIDAVLDLARGAGLRPGDVRAIVATLGPAPAATLRYAAPETGLQARFSLHHNLAAALVDGAVGFAQLDDAFVRRADVAALYGLTRIEVGGEPCPDQPGMAKFDRVTIETADGRLLDSGPVRHPRGHARLPLDEGDIAAKFLDCARHGGHPDPEGLLAALGGLAEAGDMRSEVARW